MTQHDHNTPESAAEAAAYWIMKLESPDCSPNDRAAFEKWRLTAAHARAYARANQVLALVDRNLGSHALTDLGEQVFEETNKPGRTSVLKWSGMAAAALIMMAVGMLLLPVETPEPTLATYETSIGERSTITLSDESEVTLNTDTRLQVWFDDDSEVRRVALLSGQAMFDVNKDPRPFEVFAGGQRIQALGTAFDVWLDETQGLRVTLVEGQVAIDDMSGAFSASSSASLDLPTIGEIADDIDDPGTRTMLAPGQQLRVPPGETPTVVQADVKRATGWRDGWIHLPRGGELLPQAVAEINRYSTKQIVIDADPRLESLPISGSYKTRRSKFVSLMETMYPVEAQEIASDRILLRYRESISDLEP